MIQDYEILVRIVVHGDIWPALEILWLEHRLGRTTLSVSLASRQLFPRTACVSSGKALFAGYDRDFVTALHLLVPQIEHLVRYHLKQSGAKTTTLDPNGIENEIGLTALMELSEAEKVFGADRGFELRALFCDPFGPNLRNELAHGLLDDEACQSIHSIYAWWFATEVSVQHFGTRVARQPSTAGPTARNEHRRPARDPHPAARGRVLPGRARLRLPRPLEGPRRTTATSRRRCSPTG